MPREVRRCERCGSTVPADTFWCPSCGPVLGEVGLSDHAEPARSPGDRSSRSGLRRRGTAGGGRFAAVAVAAAVLVLVFLFASSGDPDEELTPEPTATSTPTPRSTPSDSTQSLTSKASPAVSARVGDSWTWAPVVELAGVGPVGVSRSGDGYMFFGWVEAAGSGADRGLHAWTSADGATWDPLGLVLDTGTLTVSHIEATPAGYVGTATDPGGHLEGIWLSPDGRSWAPIPLPADDYALGLERPLVGGLSDAVVVMGRLDGPLLAELRSELPERFRSAESRREHWYPEPDLGRVVLRSQWGIELTSVPIAPIERSLPVSVGEAFAVEDLFVAWTWRPGQASWTKATVGVAEVGDVFSLADGRLVASGPFGNRVTVDGLEWEPFPAGDPPSQSWAGGLATVVYQGGPSLVETAADGTVDRIGLDAVVSDSSYSSRLETSNEIIVIAEALFGPQLPPRDPVTVATGNATMTWLPTNSLAVTSGEESITLTPRDLLSPATAAANLANGSVTFVDPQTRSRTVEVTLDDLEALGDAVAQSLPLRWMISASNDGRDWTQMQFDVHQSAPRIAVGDGELVVAAQVDPQIPATRIWVARPDS